ncbi:WD40/YVTN/BNR-like repeat-containing protein [Hymenobacter edaphi]|uniref:DUF6242 domain-containing protein n=1 Tax=Hymenobacter edaphi TaxID=2211146 RepID=A0A328BVU3_9BACT|nr:hypothetical protein [Hymenobacter edaphi]RAK70166.1 hypothetical protein DLM85_04770 [Hymenobacter edaphi]
MIKLFAGLLTGAALLALGSCEPKKKEDPRPTDPVPARLTLVRGGTQSGTFGAFVPDSVVLQVQPAGNAPANGYLVSYRLTGNGYVEAANNWGMPRGLLRADARGRIRVRWSLGCDLLQQKTTFYLFDASCADPSQGQCTPLDSVSARATARQGSGWVRACGGEPMSGGLQSSICNCAGRLYMVMGGKGYASQDEGVNWRLLPLPAVNDYVRFLKCNSRGTVYALMENSGVHVSNDQGATWTAVNNGILDHRYPIDLVAEDNNVFVSFFNDGLYRSTNNGGFWRKQLVAGQYWEQYSLLTRLPGGELFLVDKWSNLFKSTDNGSNWLRQTPAAQYVRSQVTALAVDHTGNLVVGSGDALLAVLNPASLTGTVSSFYTPQTHTSHSIYNITSARNRLYFVVLGNLTPGVYAGTPGSYALATPGFTPRIYNYFVKADGSLMLITDSGVYYHAP